MGKGLWSGGKWRVVFLRSMVAKDKDDVVFKKGMTMPLAFAIWDGGNLEKDGQKSVTTWHELKVE
ncbi:MAG: putative Nitrite oxidoreductase, rane subunit [Deltaproteobacteria bacterium]|nr:putative Nitrite oxidoreductase, rane subunit [Deltaproteobacteria bacterium]